VLSDVELINLEARTDHPILSENGHIIVVPPTGTDALAMSAAR